MTALTGSCGRCGTRHRSDACVCAACGAELATVLEAQRGDPALAQTWLLLADFDSAALRHAAREEKLRRALAHAQRASDEEQVDRCLIATADSLCRGPTSVVEAIHRCEQILALAGSRPILQAGVLRPLSALYAMQARHDRARQLAREAARMETDLGVEPWTAASVHSGGTVELLAGDLDGAERRLRAACTALGASLDSGLLSQAAGSLAHILDARGAHAEATQLADVAAATSGADDIEANILWRSARAKLAARRGDRREARRLGESAVALGETTDGLNVRADALVSLAEVVRLDGRTAEAAVSVRRALTFYEEKGNVVSAGKAIRMLGQLARTERRPIATRAVREESHEQ